VGVTAALAHTHAPGNVGLRGEASCPACRASGVTLTDEQRALVDEQRALVDELLAPLLDAGDVFYTTAGEDAVRVALIEVVLRSAEQERNRCRERLAIIATAYEDNARAYTDLANERYRQGDTDAGHAALGDAARFAENARTVRRVIL
jgi:hypothetical protein